MKVKLRKAGTEGEVAMSTETQSPPVTCVCSEDKWAIIEVTTLPGDEPYDWVGVTTTP